MKILFSSHCFWPEVGGIETASEALAGEFARLGHEVRMVTQTAGPDSRRWPFEVIRRPGAGLMMRLARWCDVFFHNNISLQSGWPLLAVRRPWVIAHQTWISHSGWRDRLKRLLLPFAANVAISRAVAKELGQPSEVIGNPYRSAIFTNTGGDRSGLVFVGRLVSDKGVDLAIRALGKLEGGPQLTVIGSGPEEAALRTLSAELGLADRVIFAGSQTGAALAALLNRHRIMVVPSRWAEPFGIVALEGIACGCVVVGSEAGGLPDAIGPCGKTFPNGDADALATALRELLSDDGEVARLLSQAPDHLAKHTPEAVAAAYIEVFRRAIRSVSPLCPP